MYKLDPFKVRIALKSLNSVKVWQNGPKGTLKRIRVMLKALIIHSIVDNFMLLCVLANTIILAIDHYGID